MVDVSLADHAVCDAADQLERLVEASAREPQAHLVVLLGGEAGLRRGEMIGLEWTDVNLTKRQLCVARSGGHVSAPKGGRIRYVPLTKRLAAALQAARHVRGPRVLCDEAGKPLTQKVVQVMMLHALESGGARRGHPSAGRCRGRPWRNRGGVGNEGLHPPSLLKESGGGAGSCTRVRKYLLAGIYDAYPPLKCRARREETEKPPGTSPRKSRRDRPGRPVTASLLE